MAISIIPKEVSVKLDMRLNGSGRDPHTSTTIDQGHEAFSLG